MSDGAFTHDVFLSHSSKDKAVVRAVAERLRQDGLCRNTQPSTLNYQPTGGSDWAQLEAGVLVSAETGGGETIASPVLAR